MLQQQLELEGCGWSVRLELTANYVRAPPCLHSSPLQWWQTKSKERPVGIMANQGVGEQRSRAGGKRPIGTASVRHAIAPPPPPPMVME